MSTRNLLSPIQYTRQLSLVLPDLPLHIGDADFFARFLIIVEPVAL